jgi:hypothetical protein
VSGELVGGGVGLRIGDGEPITRKERREVVLLAARPEISITWSRYAAGLTRTSTASTRTRFTCSRAS